ncbi:hypothetical protein KEM48_011743 [Puccinia striiformis f. sp. tritici PST-130]|nr:hypothetical protein KEM48_011743 [Puccinia striiformis f. sp. tritici PST-130]
MYQDSPGMTCTLLIVCISSPLDQSSFSLVEVREASPSPAFRQSTSRNFHPTGTFSPRGQVTNTFISIKPRSIPSRSSSPQISPGSRCTPALSPPSRFTHDRVACQSSKFYKANLHATTRTKLHVHLHLSVALSHQTQNYLIPASQISSVSLSGSPVIQSTTTLIPSAQQISPSLLVEAFQPSIATGSKSRRNSTDSCDSVLSCTQSSRTVNTNDSCPSFPSSPSASQTIFDSSDWNLDHRYTINTSPEAFSASIWKRKRPAPLLLPQHEPGRSQLSISETSISFEISIELPEFSPDSITVAQRRDDNSIHIVADQVTGENTGHYERLIKLQGHDPQSSPSKEVTSKFDSSKSILSVRVIKLGCSRNRQHAVVCDNGSGLTGNKTYRLIL